MRWVTLNSAEYVVMLNIPQLLLFIFILIFILLHVLATKLMYDSQLLTYRYIQT
jgi:hypothetical protein